MSNRERRPFDHLAAWRDILSRAKPPRREEFACPCSKASSRLTSVRGPSSSCHQPGGPIACEVVPGPLKQDEHAVLELNQIQDVDKEPCQPGEKAGEANPSKIGDRGGAADGRHAAVIFVMEGRNSP